MGDIPRAAAIRGKTIRYIWTDGPTKGRTYEHVFHDDGTVEWRDVGAPPGRIPEEAKPSAGEKRPEAPERVPYTAMEAGTDAYVVSYLGGTGYTLTVVLDFRTSRMVGVASGGTTWTPVQGRFEVVTY